MSGDCWDPRCRIPEHQRVEGGLGTDLTETERLTLRNALLANQDMGLTAAEATAVTYVAKPAVERILAARVASAAADREAVERVRALVERLQREGRGLIHRQVIRDRILTALSVPTEAEGRIVAEVDRERLLAYTRWLFDKQNLTCGHFDHLVDDFFRAALSEVPTEAAVTGGRE